MKLKISTGWYNGKQCVRAKAVISPSKKSGVLRQHQKTWNLITVAPELTLEEQRHAIEEEAKRWEQTILNPVIRKPPVQEKLL